MNNQNIKCPVCLNAEGGSCKRFPQSQNPWYECSICGNYEMELFLNVQIQEGVYNYGNWELNSEQRAILSHRICKYNYENAQQLSAGKVQFFRVTTQMLDSIRADGKLPSRAEQAVNLIRFVGDIVSRTGVNIELPPNIHSVIGSHHNDSAIKLAIELEERKFLRGMSISPPFKVNLTLDGWERYESEKRGQFSGNDGFLAMDFNDDSLDRFVKDVLKPVVKEKIGCNLVDMRDVPKAGIIDNIMRVQIRDAKFVIADLTHDNHGAYWEAGYAEGLGKPVIYICEKKKFEAEKTHFDTNHCTTVLWSREDDESFKQELIATLRRSIEMGS